MNKKDNILHRTTLIIFLGGVSDVANKGGLSVVYRADVYLWMKMADIYTNFFLY